MKVNIKEKFFPIYYFSLRWNQSDYKNNFTSWYTMFKEKPTTEDLENVLKEAKKHMEVRMEKKEIEITEWLDCNYKYIEDESWCLRWFNHYTYNQFETDEEAEKSFMNFVDRKISGDKENALMGAEDIWRWKICRCEHCQKVGKITIDH